MSRRSGGERVEGWGGAGFVGVLRLGAVRLAQDDSVIDYH
jgi:hypothetical protein